MGHGDSFFWRGVDIVLSFIGSFFILSKQRRDCTLCYVHVPMVTVTIARVTALANCDTEVSDVHLVNLKSKVFFFQVNQRSLPSR